MSTLTVLAVGATGNIGRQVVAEALAGGHHVRALVRNRDRALGLHRRRFVRRLRAIPFFAEPAAGFSRRVLGWSVLR